MVNFKKKATIIGTAALALAVSTGSQAALMPNGDFEAGSANWGIFESGAGDAQFDPGPGGNPGGFGFVANTSGGWGGGFVQEDVAGGKVCDGGATFCGLALADYGLSGGDTTTFSFDVKDFNGDGAGVTGIKLESWSATTHLSNTGDVHFAQGDSLWNTIFYDYTFDAAATHFKVVLVGTNAGQVGFDNLNINAVPVPAAVWLFGSGLLGLVGVARKKKAA